MTTFERNTARRTVLKATGATLALALVAGCTGDDDDGGDDGGGGDAGGFEVAPGTVSFDGYSSHWEGVGGDIDGERNPTLVLEDGGEYTFEWTNADNMLHDLQIWDADEDVVDDLISDETDVDGETVSLTFTASADMAYYVCSYHQVQQIGELVVE